MQFLGLEKIVEKNLFNDDSNAGDVVEIDEFFKIYY